MIFAVPFFFPVTTPLEDTVAIFLLDEVYFTVPVGVAVALIVVFFPTLMLAEVLNSPVLTKSGKSPASIAKSNKQWVGTCLYQEACKRLLINCGAVIWL